MRIKNTSKRLIVLNYKENGKDFKSLPLGAGTEATNEHITEEDIAYYVKKESIKVLDKATTDNQKDTAAVVLPEDANEESMKSLTVEELKRYCKENGIKKYSSLDEEALISLILTSLQPKE